MGKDQAYVWRDANDKNTYHFGIHQGDDRYLIWFSVFVDGMTEMFGTDWRMLERVVGTTPVKVNLEISI